MLPEEICIDGRNYAVNTDFQVWIELSDVINNGKLSIFERLEQALSLCYKEKLPPTLEDAMEGIAWFLSAGDNEKKGKSSGTPLVDFLEDFPMIAAAFWHDYRIDLWRENLHWWQFRALFLSLSDSNRIMKVIAFRGTNISGIKDKEQKNYYRKMKEFYRLPDKRNVFEQEQDMIKELGEIFEEVT